MVFAGLVLQDPQNNSRFIQKQMAKLHGMSKEQIDTMFPPTPDEMQAEDENQLLNIGKLPDIGVQDDHRTHIEIHSKANQNGVSMAHMRAHKKLMIIKRNRTDLFPPQQPGMMAVPGERPNTAAMPEPTTATQ